MRRIVVPALALVAALGCSEDRLADATGEVRVLPEEAVEFPRTYVGYPTTAIATVENTGRAPADLAVSVDGPFQLAPPPGRIPGAGAVDLFLSFAPEAPGSAAGTLVVVAGGKRFERPVTATAVALPDCSTALACRIASFDPTTGSCLHEPAPDGAACSSHCVADGQCLDGVCRGAGDGCDDGDPCTRDLIADDCTCRHETLPDRPSADPCRTETCVPGVGWQETLLPDGTVCGEVNECVGHFCREGSCQAGGEALEGSICQDGSPCRRPGRCRRGTGGVMECRPAPDEFTMAPVWRVAPAGGREIHFDAVTDDFYVYWAECDAGGCGLRSISPLVYRDDETGSGMPDPDPLDFTYDPFDRWNGPVAMFSGEVNRNGGLFLSRGRLYSTLRTGWLEAYETGLGEPVFRLDLTAHGIPVGRGGTAVNAHGDVVLLLAAPGEAAPRTVLAVSPEGELVWKVRREGFLRGLLADEHGHVYLGEETDQTLHLVSLDGDGNERFAVEAPGKPLAAFGGRLVHGDGTLRSTADGTPVGNPLPVLVPDSPLPPLLSPGAGWLGGYPLVEQVPAWDRFSLLPFDPITGEGKETWLELGSGATPWGRSEPLLLPGPGSERVLVVRSNSTDPCANASILVEAKGDGTPVTDCRLAPGSYGGPATVLSSLWITHDACRGMVTAFLLEVAGQGPRSLAPRGWIGGGGDPGRGNRPLP